MGMFKKKVKVSNLRKPELFFEEDFWVDTGALYPILAVIGGFLASAQ